MICGATLRLPRLLVDVILSTEELAIGAGSICSLVIVDISSIRVARSLIVSLESTDGDTERERVVLDAYITKDMELSQCLCRIMCCELFDFKCILSAGTGWLGSVLWVVC